MTQTSRPTAVQLPWAQFDGPEPIRPRRETGWCNPGEAGDPGRSCTVHGGEHHYCATCKGWYGVPHDRIHEDGPVRSAHPCGRLGDHCACRPCRTYDAMTLEARHAALLAYDLAQGQQDED